jgi:hypothetical protein
MVQGVLVGPFESDTLNHPTFAKKSRALILTQAYREAMREIDRGADV